MAIVLKMGKTPAFTIFILLQVIGCLCDTFNVNAGEPRQFQQPPPPAQPLAQPVAPVQHPQQVAPVQHPQQVAPVQHPQQVAPVQHPQQVAPVQHPQLVTPPKTIPVAVQHPHVTGATGYLPPTANKSPADPFAHLKGMNIEDTQVHCHKTYMTVTLWFSAPFHGLIYPYNKYHKCLLYVGDGKTELTLKLSHGECGQGTGLVTYGTNLHYPNPIIEHHLMIQWDREIVEEWDSNLIVRCDRPDDYQKTISFDLSTIDKQAALDHATHPSPTMYMEIQRGEGPKAERLESPVYVGETLTLVFTVTDNVFPFDTNILECHVYDGSTQQAEVKHVMVNTQSAPKTPAYLGQMLVIQDGCSARPKVFGNFQKKREKYDKHLSTTAFAFFKAFHFPTKNKLLIQCRVQICYKSCPPQPECGVNYAPRSRARRATEDEGVEIDEMNMLRTIEVLSDGGLQIMAGQPDKISGKNCVTSMTFYGTVFGLGCLLLVLLLVFGILFTKKNQD